IVAPELTAAGAAVSAFLIRSASPSASAGTTNVVRATAAPTVAENASFFMERPPFTFAMERHPSDDQRRPKRLARIVAGASFGVLQTVWQMALPLSSAAALVRSSSVEVTATVAAAA